MRFMRDQHQSDNLSPSIETLSQLPTTEILGRRRAKIQEAIKEGEAALISAGSPAARNFPANHYTGFRASSHFLYCVGQHLSSAMLLLTRNNAFLYVPTPSPSRALWHGEEKSFATLAQEIGCEVRALSELESALASLSNVMRPPTYQAALKLKLSALTGRDDDPRLDLTLHHALVEARLLHDDEAIKQLRYASSLTGLAHHEGLKATRHAKWSHQIRAAMESPLMACGANLAYAPIITPHGEVLHNHAYHSPIASGDLILADVGAETPQGWAGDVTRTWPVSGEWSETQRAAYEVVLRALKASTALAKPGVEYASLHQKTREVLAEGLIDLGILRGSVEENLDANSVALFFPHGVGHLLGLDVHDMEDLGDLAGYASGRERRDTFGWGYLRLDRPLATGMAITIEPGFYQVPTLLKDPSWAGPSAGKMIDWDALSRFNDVRGIRIEDDILITDDEPEVLSAHIPYEVDELSQIIRS